MVLTGCLSAYPAAHLSCRNPSRILILVAKSGNSVGYVYVARDYRFVDLSLIASLAGRAMPGWEPEGAGNDLMAIHICSLESA